MRTADITNTAIGPILIPSVSSWKNRINPAPAAGIGASRSLRFFTAIQITCVEVVSIKGELKGFALNALISQMIETPKNLKTKE